MGSSCPSAGVDLWWTRTPPWGELVRLEASGAVGPFVVVMVMPVHRHVAIIATIIAHAVSLGQALTPVPMPVAALATRPLVAAHAITLRPLAAHAMSALAVIPSPIAAVEGLAEDPPRPKPFEQARQPILLRRVEARHEGRGGVRQRLHRLPARDQALASLTQPFERGIALAGRLLPLHGRPAISSKLGEATDGALHWRPKRVLVGLELQAGMQRRHARLEERSAVGAPARLAIVLLFGAVAGAAAGGVVGGGVAGAPDAAWAMETTRQVVANSTPRVK